MKNTCEEESMKLLIGGYKFRYSEEVFLHG